MCVTDSLWGAFSASSCPVSCHFLYFDMTQARMRNFGNICEFLNISLLEALIEAEPLQTPQRTNYANELHTLVFLDFSV